MVTHKKRKTITLEWKALDDLDFLCSTSKSYANGTPAREITTDNVRITGAGNGFLVELFCKDCGEVHDCWRGDCNDKALQDSYASLILLTVPHTVNTLAKLIATFTQPMTHFRE